MKNRIWLVGGSSGIGYELVQQFLDLGYSVIASSRNATKNNPLTNLQQKYPENLNCLDIDVKDETSINKAVDKAFDIYGGLDIWFYNAGDYEVMGIDSLNISRFEDMMHINYLGAVKIMARILPYFQKQGYGRWIWNSSLSSYFGLPRGGGYSAPKVALVNLAESIQPELLSQNIELQIINHGFVKTRLTQKNKFSMPQLMEPEEAAKQIIHHMEKPYRFEIRFPFMLSFFLRLLKFLPYSISLGITKKLL